jgi:hypothetical protein
LNRLASRDGSDHLGSCSHFARFASPIPMNIKPISQREWSPLETPMAIPAPIHTILMLNRARQLGLISSFLRANTTNKATRTATTTRPIAEESASVRFISS